jgi:hypothetical protein
MHKSVTKCNETLIKWCKNKHGASKIIDTFETYQRRLVSRPRGRQALRDASGTRSAMKTMTYNRRVVIKKADRRCISLKGRAGASGPSWRALPFF